MGAAAAMAIRHVLCGAGFVLAVPLVACSSVSDDEADTDNLAIVAAPLKPAAQPKAVSPTPIASATPTPKPSAMSDMRPHKSFTDPPLPRELREDGGLIPLPPPPGTSPASGAPPTR